MSIGMSADLEAAVAEGSTMVRVGTAIFGARQPRQPDEGRIHRRRQHGGCADWRHAHAGFAADDIEVLEIDAARGAELAKRHQSACTRSRVDG